MRNNSQRMQQLGESEEALEEAMVSEVTNSTRGWIGLKDDKEEDTGGWLETDEIRDF